ncbi:hypothetical protein [Ancylomarina longa]|uniref:TIR domain-containing protein n=1 Tax=Ancylomarina longa TaxID=2487017 RepID=A0A434AF14_9BACT|nr:hypothetical protein [Ancylomarina longa]RUT72932.1 hypothetical protein DLK05_15850 [Ancylomarina longa]
MSKKNKPKAFISCSVRDEDLKFNTAIEKVVKRYGFEPCGTVGRHVNYAEPISDSMKKEIQACDILVVAAPPRYIQSEISDKANLTYAIPEMIQVESAMAHSFEKPVVAFVQDGVNIGNFIPNITQYFLVDAQTYKVKASRQLKPFFKDLHKRVAVSIKEKDKEAFGWLVLFSFAVVGIYTAIKWIRRWFTTSE